MCCYGYCFSYRQTSFEEGVFCLPLEHPDITLGNHDDESNCIMLDGGVCCKPLITASRTIPIPLLDVRGFN